MNESSEKNRVLPHVEDLYQSWFLDYASYVILDRAVPDIRDGLKPVQRRILHALWELDDGRLNKAANVIGHTMRYHPHGDMAIEDALVKIGQKDLLIDMQGNWGNILTGDRAAAPRYIEARLSTLGKEILFQEEITEWQASYDGRNKEPVSLPVKFPLLLSLGVEGIAVGLSTRVLPHHFGELCDAAIAYLKDKPITLYPDFITGGLADFSQYKEGQRGGRVRVRARIEAVDNKTLKITEIPFGTTTGGLIDSILAAHDKGKIKVKKVEDNTSRDVEILVKLPPGVPVEQTEEALYAFTDCEVSIATYACVIKDEHPLFCSTIDLLKFSTEQTRDILRRELELLKAQLRAKIHKATLEGLFIEHKIYRKLEGAESWEEALDRLRKAFKPFLKDIEDEVSDADFEALLEMRFKRLTRYDSEQAEKHLTALREQMADVESKLKNLTAHTVKWFESLKKRYGKAPRRTTIASFQEVQAREVVLANQKLYVNREAGFLGTGLKSDEFVAACSELDEVVVLRAGGQLTLLKVAEKFFAGEQIQYIGILPVQASDAALHVIYQEQNEGPIWAKRIRLSGMQKEKSYDLLKSGGRILHVRVMDQKLADWVEIERLGAAKSWAFNFASLPWSTRAGKGQMISVRGWKGLTQLETVQRPPVTLVGDKNRIQIGGQGPKLGTFEQSDLLVALTQDGFMKVFPATEQQTLSSPLVKLLRVDREATLCLVARGKDALLARRLPMEDLADGMELALFAGKEKISQIWVSTDSLGLCSIQYEESEGLEAPPEILPLNELVPVRGLQNAATRILRSAVKSIADVNKILPI